MKALLLNSVVVGIERRDIDVYEYYHEDIAKLFVDCPDDTEIGDIYEDGVFHKPISEPVEEPNENGGTAE